MLAEEKKTQNTVNNQSAHDCEVIKAQSFTQGSGLVPHDKQQKQLQCHSYLNQSMEESSLSPQKESARRLTESKLKHKKLKQKLNMLSEQILDQGLLKDQKDITSSNKSRLLKLSIELDRAIRTQAIDYPLVESILKQIQKIVQHKREHDILILRGARFMTTLIAIIKRFPSLHRTEAAQSMSSMESSLRLLKIMLSLSASRDLLLITNQVTAISSLLSCALMRQQKKLLIPCLYILNLILSGPNRIQLHQIINANLQYMLCSSLIKRLKSYLQNCIAQDDPVHSEFILLAFKFYYLIMSQSCQKELGRPIYGTPVMDNLSRAISTYFESGIQLLAVSLVELIFQRQFQGDQKCSYREQDIPNFKINIFLYIFKTLNTIFHVNISFAQKMLECNMLFMKAIYFIFTFAKNNFKQSQQIKNLCSQVIVFIGNLSSENEQMQNLIRESGLLTAFCDHPLEYTMMDPLKHIFVPALCSVIHQNRKNFKEVFEENSVVTVLKYVEKQINSSLEKKIEDEPCVQLEVPNLSTQKTLSRKTSVSSMNSSYSTYSKTSMAESYSTQGSMSTGLWIRQKRLDYKFRQEYWEGLVVQLKKIDD